MVRLYFGAGLFNGPHAMFNSILTEILEKKGYEILLPQRDGFEFGNLSRTLEDKLPKKDIPSAVQTIIYFLDVGKFIPESDAVLANFDEPIDEGLVVETVYSKLFGKQVIAFRTDVRNPFGSIEDKFGGMHFFPAYQSDVFLSHQFPSRNKKERDENASSLAEKISEEIRKKGIILRGTLPEYILKIPLAQRLLKGAEILFKEIDEINSEESIKLISKRYVENKAFLDSISPKYIR